MDNKTIAQLIKNDSYLKRLKRVKEAAEQAYNSLTIKTAENGVSIEGSNIDKFVEDHKPIAVTVFLYAEIKLSGENSIVQKANITRVPKGLSDSERYQLAEVSEKALRQIALPETNEGKLYIKAFRAGFQLLVYLHSISSRTEVSSKRKAPPPNLTEMNRDSWQLVKQIGNKELLQDLQNDSTFAPGYSMDKYKGISYVVEEKLSLPEHKALTAVMLLCGARDTRKIAISKAELLSLYGSSSAGGRNSEVAYQAFLDLSKKKFVITFEEPKFKNGVQIKVDYTRIRLSLFETWASTDGQQGVLIHETAWGLMKKKGDKYYKLRQSFNSDFEEACQKAAGKKVRSEIVYKGVLYLHTFTKSITMKEKTLLENMGARTKMDRSRARKTYIPLIFKIAKEMGHLKSFKKTGDQYKLLFHALTQ